MVGADCSERVVVVDRERLYDESDAAVFRVQALRLKEDSGVADAYYDFRGQNGQAKSGRKRNALTG